MATTKDKLAFVHGTTPMCSNCGAGIDLLTYDESGDVFCTSCGTELLMSKTELLEAQRDNEI